MLALIHHRPHHGSKTPKGEPRPDHVLRVERTRMAALERLVLGLHNPGAMPPQEQVRWFRSSHNNTAMHEMQFQITLRSGDTAMRVPCRATTSTAEIYDHAQELLAHGGKTGKPFTN